jgi:flagellar protein FliS
MAINAAATYQNSKIMTASPQELTLMLYDGAIKFCNLAMIAIDNKEIQKAHANIVKAENIISEFRATLDPKYSTAKDFDIMYEYINRRLMEGNLKKDKEIIEEALVYIKEMRDTWKELMKPAEKLA